MSHWSVGQLTWPPAMTVCIKFTSGAFAMEGTGGGVITSTLAGLLDGGGGKGVTGGGGVTDLAFFHRGGGDTSFFAVTCFFFFFLLLFSLSVSLSLLDSVDPDDLQCILVLFFFILHFFLPSS